MPGDKQVSDTGFMQILWSQEIVCRELGRTRRAVPVSGSQVPDLQTLKGEPQHTPAVYRNESPVPRTQEVNVVSYRFMVWFSEI